jgi:hypothetical protein
MDSKLLRKVRKHPKHEIKASDQRIIDLETRTKGDIERIMETNDFSRNSESWKDYERAKKILFDDRFPISSEIHDQQTKWIIDYLNI